MLAVDGGHQKRSVSTSHESGLPELYCIEKEYDNVRKWQQMRP